MRLVVGEAERGPVASSAVLVGALALLTFTVLAGYPVHSVAPVVALVVASAVAYRTLLSWRSLLALIVVVILFVPIKRYELPAGLPFRLEPYRVVVALVSAGWISSLLIDPRVRLRRSRLDGPLLAYGLAVLGSLVANRSRVSALGEDVVKTLMFLASFFLVFYLLVSVVRRSRDVDFLARVLAGGGAIVSVFALVESRTGYNVFNHLSGVIPFVHLDNVPFIKDRGDRLRVYASGQHPIALGAALVMLLPLAVYRARSFGQLRWWLAAGLLALGAVATISRTAIVMLVVAAAVLVWLRPRDMRRLVPALLASFLLAYLALPGTLGTLKESFLPPGGLIEQQRDAGVGHARLSTLVPALLREFRPNPLLGEGFGTRITTPDEVVAVPNAPILDDQWLGTLLETGVLGAAALAWMFLRAGRRFGRAARDDPSPRGWFLAATTASVSAYAVSMFTYDAFSFIQVTFLLFILLGLGSAALALEGGRDGDGVAGRRYAGWPSAAGQRQRDRRRRPMHENGDIATQRKSHSGLRFPTPSEIRSVVPRRSVRGYAREEIDRLLAAVAEGYEEVWRERDDLRGEVAELRARASEGGDSRGRIEQLEAELAGYRQLEQRLRNTLLAADGAAEKLKSQARRESEAMLKKARLRAERIVSDAIREHEVRKAEIRRLEHLEHEVRAGYRNFLAATMERLQREIAESGAPEQTRAGRGRNPHRGRGVALPPPLPDLDDDPAAS